MKKQSSVFKTILILALGAILICNAPAQPASAALIPITAAAADAEPIENTLPTLQDFSTSLATGEADLLVGVYAAKVMAFPVLQQPANDAAFVSTQEDVLTQFGMTSQFNSIGLLAHNYLAGAHFSDLSEGQLIFLVYGDGSAQAYRIQEIDSYQALSPYSPYSDFVDLENGGQLSAAQLFERTYGQSGTAILQTCIDRDGIDSWGRLFVIAEPINGLARINLQIANQNF